MNNNKQLIIQGKTKVCGKEIPNVYGGFGNGQKVILAKTVTELHERELRKVNELINNHLKDGYFEQGIDYIDLKNSVLENEIILKFFKKQAKSNSNSIYILSELGYLKLSKIMEDKLISKQILKEYFNINDNKIVIAERYENTFKNFITYVLSDYIVIKTQFPILNYQVDFFIPEIKLIIEYDENRHKYYIEQDKIRENNIQNEFKRWEEDEYFPVKFIRVKQNEELEGINLIMREISENTTSVINSDRIDNEKPYNNIKNLYDFYSNYYTKEYCDTKLQELKDLTNK